MRCCIYKERAIVTQRVQMAMGGHPGHTTQVEVLPIACDECPVSQVTVSDACRGCIATVAPTPARNIFTTDNSLDAASTPEKSL